MDSLPCEGRPVRSVRLRASGGRRLFGRVHAPRLTLLGVALLGTLAFGQPASGVLQPPCLRSVVARGWAVAPLEATAVGSQHRAVAAALAAAVGQVRGVFVSVETELVERFQATLTAEGERFVSESILNQTIQTRAAGLVSSFRVVQLRESNGLLEASVDADVCLDSRMAVRWLGPMQGEEAFLLAFRQAMGASGWQVVHLPSEGGRDRLQLAFDTGATHMATVRGRATSAGSRYEQQQFDVRIEVVVVDLVSAAVSSGIETAFPVVGRDQADAHGIAAACAGGELANSVLRNVGAVAVDGLGRRDITVTGARRAHTAIELRALLLGVAGVVALEVVDSGARNELRYALQATVSACAIADELARQRRLLLHVRHCDVGAALIEVLRE